MGRPMSCYLLLCCGSIVIQTLRQSANPMDRRCPYSFFDQRGVRGKGGKGTNLCCIPRTGNYLSFSIGLSGQL